MAARPEKVAHAYCLFPTISHIALSPNGVRATPFFNPYTLLFVTFLDSLLLLLPAFFLKLLVGLVTRHREPALTVTTSIVSTPCAVSEALYMALDELDTIKDLDRSFLESFGDRLTFYWAEGERDEWVPDRTVKEIVAVLDTRKSTLKRWYRCDEGMVHAFCLGPPPLSRPSPSRRNRADSTSQTIAWGWPPSARAGSETTTSDRRRFPGPDPHAGATAKAGQATSLCDGRRDRTSSRRDRPTATAHATTQEQAST